MNDDKSIFSRIDELVSEEHELRSKHAAGQVDNADDQTRLRAYVDIWAQAVADVGMTDEHDTNPDSPDAGCIFALFPPSGKPD